MDGWDGIGWDGMYGMDRMEYQKCPSNFFILCVYIEYVYTYLYIYSKIVTNILMGVKISCQVGGFRGQKMFFKLAEISLTKPSQVVVKIKSELLDRKSITSPTCCNFEIFDHDPQLDIKFLNP